VRNSRRDGGRPSKAARQGEALNDLKLLGLRAQVVSVEEKALEKKRHVWTSETNASEPLPTHRKQYDDIKTGSCFVAWDQSSDHLCLGWAVSGVEMA
jgi:hypothetical protein